MRRADVVGGSIAVLFGVFGISQSVQIDYWWKFGPGPGFLPLWAAIVMVFGGILLLIQALRKPGPTTRSPADPGRLRRYLGVAAVAGLTVLAALAMTVLGFNVAIFLFMALMVGVLGKYRWYTTLGTALLVSLSFYVLFAKWLQIPLPTGVLGF